MSCTSINNILVFMFGKTQMSSRDTVRSVLNGANELGMSHENVSKKDILCCFLKVDKTFNLCLIFVKLTDF